MTPKVSALFLECVDSRFWLWRDLLRKEYENHANIERRWLFIYDNKNKIDKRVETNEKSIRENFLGHKILGNQAWPGCDEGQ